MKNVPPSVRNALKKRGQDAILEQEGDYSQYKAQIDQILHNNEPLESGSDDYETDIEMSPEETKANKAIEGYGEKYSRVDTMTPDEITEQAVGDAELEMQEKMNKDDYEDDLAPVTMSDDEIYANEVSNRKINTLIANGYEPQDALDFVDDYNERYGIHGWNIDDEGHIIAGIDSNSNNENGKIQIENKSSKIAKMPIKPAKIEENERYNFTFGYNKANNLLEYVSKNPTNEGIGQIQDMSNMFMRDLSFDVLYNKDSYEDKTSIPLVEKYREIGQKLLDFTNNVKNEDMYAELNIIRRNALNLINDATNLLKRQDK